MGVTEPGTKFLLLFVGLVSGIATISAGVTQSNIDWLVTSLLVVTSGGFVATGGLWLASRRTEAPLYPRLPAMTLVLFGINCIIGALVSFSPVRSTVNQGLQMLLIGVLLLTGVVLVFGGWRWFQEQQMRYPLSILSGVLVLGLAYINPSTVRYLRFLARDDAYRLGRRSHRNGNRF